MSRELNIAPIRSAGRHHVAGAFSLTEVVAVLAIVSVAAAIAAPRYGGAISSYRSQLAAQRLAADLELARAHARATSSSVSIDFNGPSYTIDTVTALDADDTYHVDLARAPYHVTVTRSTSFPQSLTFNAYGVPNGGGSISVQSSRHTRTVVLDAVSGFARVE